MSSLLSISVNIVIPGEILSQIFAVQTKLSTGFSEKRNYDPAGHLSALNKFMEDEEFGVFTKIITDYFRSVKPFEVTFDHFGKTDGNRYIFLYLEKDSAEKIMKIHDDLIILTKNIGNETWDAKPSTFAFLPHISMIKLDSSVIDQVLNTLKNAESKWSFVATALEVSKEVKVRGEHVGFNRDTVIYLT